MWCLFTLSISHMGREGTQSWVLSRVWKRWWGHSVTCACVVTGSVALSCVLNNSFISQTNNYRKEKSCHLNLFKTASDGCTCLCTYSGAYGRVAVSSTAMNIVRSVRVRRGSNSVGRSKRAKHSSIAGAVTIARPGLWWGEAVIVVGGAAGPWRWVGGGGGGVEGVPSPRAVQAHRGGDLAVQGPRGTEGGVSWPPWVGWAWSCGGHGVGSETWWNQRRALCPFIFPLNLILSWFFVWSFNTSQFR